MSFEHGEFLMWMGLPISVLFYLWITQKPMFMLPFSPIVFDKLRVKDASIGLKGRNILFFIAAWLMIVALSEPIMGGDRLASVPLTKVIVIDISSTKEFELMKKNVIREISSTQGAIELLAIDEDLYRIAPATLDRKMLIDLLSGLRAKQAYGVYQTESLKHIKGQYLLFSGEKKTDQNLQDQSEHYEKIPLFYYPLGLSMILIALALSSMSKRESVSMGWIVLLILPYKNLDAGVMDFRILDRAYEAYARQEFDKSAELFGRYQMIHDSPEVRYNRANALQCAGHYEQARFWYERVYTTDPKLRESLQWNLNHLSHNKNELQKLQTKKSGKKEERSAQKKLKVVEGETPLFRY